MAVAKQIALSFDFDEPITPLVATVPTAPNVPIEIATSILPTTTITKLLPPTNIMQPQQVEPIVAATTKALRTNNKQYTALTNLLPDEQLYSKQYYTMSEVTNMFNVTHSLIRYWEAEFDVLQPKKNKKGDRLFKPSDIKNLEIIYYLLRKKKYTIDGAKTYLKSQKKMHQQYEAIQQLENLKSFLLEIKANLTL